LEKNVTKEYLQFRDRFEILLPQPDYAASSSAIGTHAPFRLTRGAVNFGDIEMKHKS